MVRYFETSHIKENNLKRKTLLTLGLLGVVLLSACTPSASDAPPATIEDASETATLPEIETAPTSRGSELQATDPATVNLASGEPQLIEFFAFW